MKFYIVIYKNEKCYYHLLFQSTPSKPLLAKAVVAKAVVAKAVVTLETMEVG